MALDLASLNSGFSPGAVEERMDRLNLIATPQPPSLSRGMIYVSTYIRAFYYPHEDAVAWIQKNYKDYKLNHALALVVTGQERKRVMALYR